VPNNTLFPKPGQIFKSSTRDFTDSIGRPSLDTLYQVVFSFGNYETWLQSYGPENGVFAKGGFREKLSIMCAEAEIPGTSFQTSLAVGHHQGIQEEFPNLRTFPPLNLTFYVDADHVILEVFESWMTYINPITSAKRSVNAYGRFNYPEDYKEILHITKFERDTFLDELPAKTTPPQLPRESTTKLTSYEFVNVWPTNMTSMRVAYGDTNVLRCSVQFAYDRFFTTFNYDDINAAVESTYFNLLSSKEQAAANSLKDSYDVGNTWPLSAEGKKQQEDYIKSQEYSEKWKKRLDAKRNAGLHNK
tara:strand:- start:806 stop:1714 length:909 start_codon:yes stop_codon:yes gene_type:complete